jgi:peptidyl-prolyl cis-trans isomerase C
MNRYVGLRSLALFLLFAWLAGQPVSAEVLVSVGDLQVTSEDLELALGSSPFSTQFNTMEEDDQAGIRGDMLRRLVGARLLALEAQRLGLNKSLEYRKDIEDFRLGLLYRYYIERLRTKVNLPPESLAAMQRQYVHDPDGLAAAKSAWIAGEFRALKQATLQDLLLREHARLHEERIAEGVQADTVLLESDSFRIHYADIVDLDQHPSLPNPEWVKERLNSRGELLLFASAAQREGVDVSDKLAKYEAERLPALMLESKARQWIPDEDTLRAWLAKHPETAVVPERRHVGQLVVATRKQAEDLRGRIVAGESLFALAGRYSIDPESRRQNGDVGWIVEGRGMPELDHALAKLDDGQVSEVIQTKLGYHLMTVLERQPRRHEPFAQIRERVRQLLINEKLRQYLGELERRYTVTWKVLPGSTATARAAPAL